MPNFIEIITEEMVLFGLLGAFLGLLNSLFTEYLIYRYEEKMLSFTPLSAIKKAPIFHFLIILSSIVLTIVSYQNSAFLDGLIFSLVFSHALIILTFVDIRIQILPDLLTKGLIIIGLMLGYFGVFIGIEESLIGAVVGYLILWTINTVFRLVRKKEGMGYGDFKLLSAIGAWAGASFLPLIFIMSSLFGIFFAFIMLSPANRTMSAQIPFGPSLAISGVLCFFYGNDILRWYLNLFTPY